MANKLNLEVLTPEKPVFKGDVDEVTVPGLDGELGILPQHAPLTSQLADGILTYRLGAEKIQIHLTGGFVEVSSDTVSVLADGITE